MNSQRIRCRGSMLHGTVKVRDCSSAAATAKNHDVEIAEAYQRVETLRAQAQASPHNWRAANELRDAEENLRRVTFVWRDQAYREPLTLRERLSAINKRNKEFWKQRGGQQ